MTAAAALGSLLALTLGVSRTTLAVAQGRHLPHALAAVPPRYRLPHPQHRVENRPQRGPGAPSRTP